MEIINKSEASSNEENTDVSLVYTYGHLRRAKVFAGSPTPTESKFRGTCMRNFQEMFGRHTETHHAIAVHVRGSRILALTD